MSKVLDNVIELYHTYDKAKNSDERVYLVSPQKYSNVDTMYHLLNFIFFSAEEIDDHAIVDEDLMVKILMEVYGFTSVDTGAVMNAMSYDMYIVREAGCGRVNIKDKYMIKKFSNQRLYEILNEKFAIPKL